MKVVDIDIKQEENDYAIDLGSLDNDGNEISPDFDQSGLLGNNLLNIPEIPHILFCIYLVDLVRALFKKYWIKNCWCRYS